MKLCLTLEHRFLQTPDKKVWTITQCPYEFYREYLEVFDSVRVISPCFLYPGSSLISSPWRVPASNSIPCPVTKGPLGF